MHVFHKHCVDILSTAVIKALIFPPFDASPRSLQLLRLGFPPFFLTLDISMRDTRSSSDFTIAEKFRFLEFSFNQFEADLRGVLAKHDDVATATNNIGTALSDVTNKNTGSSSSLFTLYRKLIVLDSCMETFASGLQEMRHRQNRSQHMMGFDRKIHVVRQMLLASFEFIRAREDTIIDPPINVLCLEDDTSATKTSPVLNSSTLASQLEIFSLCFEGVKTDFAEQTDLVDHNTVEIPRAGSRYMIRSVINGGLIVGKPNYVRTICLPSELKHAATSEEYHWDVLQHNGWDILKNARHGSTLGFVRATKHSCLEGTIQSAMGQDSHLAMRYNVSQGSTFCGLVDGKLEEILMRTQDGNSCMAISDAFEFVKVK